MLLSISSIFIDSNKILGKCAKYGIFHQNGFAVLLFKVCAWLFNHAAGKIGLRLLYQARVTGGMAPFVLKIRKPCSISCAKIARIACSCHRRTT